MRQCYNWDDNVLRFTDVNDNRFNFEFKGNKTIVSGESASGKTLTCNMLTKFRRDSNKMKPYDSDNIFILNEDNKDKIIDQDGKLIIIDRAELMLDSNLVDFINRDRGKNRYLIFLRKPIGIELSPNHFAELINNNGEISLQYEYDVKGWN